MISCAQQTLKQHRVEGTAIIPKLELLWETDTLLTTVESVIYDAKSNYIYTTNIEGHFMKKDGKGSISKVSLDGTIVERDWISGLHAPTGTAIYKGKLYITDIDRIVEIAIAEKKITRIYDLKGAKALNDIEVKDDGTVYASDTGGDQIFELKDGKVRLVMEGIDTPNGLFFKNDRLLMTSWRTKTVNYLDINTKTIQQISTNIPGPDGIEALEDHGFLVSGFQGFVYFIGNDGIKTLLLDSSQKKIKAADIDYIADKKILLVPTMQNNKVMAYKLVY